MCVINNTITLNHLITKYSIVKKMTLLIAFSFAMSFSAIGQTLVSTQVQARNAVLEEFTGIRCGYCPEGHAIAQQLIDDKPGRFVAIAIHQGSFASPGSGEPDYRTEFGDAIAIQTGLTGYPSGTINRHVFSGSNTALNRGVWAESASEIMAQNSYVNVGAETSYNSNTRELTVNVELYYTSDSPESSNYINVALLQSHIFGPQSGGNTGNNYEHNHMLRYLITGQWGEEITTTTSGTFIQRTYTYTVPEKYNNVDCIVEDCDIAVFVAESTQEIYSGVAIHAIDGTTLITGELVNNGENALAGEPSAPYTFTLDFTNILPDTEEFRFTLSSVDAPNDWSSSFTINGIEYSSSAIETIESNATMTFSINITPANTSGLSNYLISVSSVSNPNAFALSQNLYVISNVGTLLLHNQGRWGNGEPADFEDDYFAGFDEAQITDYASCSYKSINAIADAGLINEFTNIYFNVAWTFPSLTDKSVEFLSAFINNGGNLFIAGQDMGWDTWNPNGNGTTNTKEFYTNYLSANYKDDGSIANHSVNANTNDEIFGNTGTSSISDIYGGNMYPDEIAPLGDASSILYYNQNTNKGAGVRSIKGTAKIVYLGFDPSMLSNEDVRNKIISNTYEWFMLDFGVNSIKNTNIIIYPNPANDFVNIQLEANNNSKTTIELYNVLGSLLFYQEYTNTDNSNPSLFINTTNLKNGVYIISVKDDENSMQKRLIINK